MTTKINRSSGQFFIYKDLLCSAITRRYWYTRTGVHYSTFIHTKIKVNSKSATQAQQSNDYEIWLDKQNRPRNLYVPVGPRRWGGGVASPGYQAAGAATKGSSPERAIGLVTISFSETLDGSVTSHGGWLLSRKCGRGGNRRLHLLSYS